MRTLRRLALFALAVGLAAGAASSAAQNENGVPAPIADPGDSMTLGARPPRGPRPTIVLFDGTNVARWALRDGAACPWTIQSDGSMQAGGGDAVTTESFGDFQLHVEFMCPLETGQTGQHRANSGVYVHGRYEVQVLDTFGQPPALNGCGAVYNIAKPLENAARPPGEWQTYDIAFRAPRFKDGDVSELPRITVLHNGIVIHSNLELPTVTAGGLDDVMKPTGPLLLQDHGDPVRYRNIWIRPL